ncbi:MAG: hypothetical protein JRZ94_05850, partial [Nitrososphaerota archaeon]|nr:hypothetical protein [Nitrososphaerota archaeon]
MASKVLGLVAITMLLSTVLVMALAAEQTVEAKTSKESPKHKFSKWYKNKVCGDQLCGGTPVYKVPTKI